MSTCSARPPAARRGARPQGTGALPRRGRWLALWSRRAPARRARWLLAVLLAVVLVAGGVTACSGRADQEAAARASASARAEADTVGRDVTVCGMVSAGDVEEAVGQQIKEVLYWTDRPGQHDDLGCYLRFYGKGPFTVVRIDYEYQRLTELDADGANEYKSITAHKNARPATVEGIAGQGLAVLDGQARSVVWSYPSGYLLVLSGGRSNEVDADDETMFSLLKNLLALIADKAPQAATGPDQPLTGYPASANNRLPTPGPTPTAHKSS